MLSVLPTEVKAIIASHDQEVWYLFYRMFDDFAKYAQSANAIIDFTTRFTTIMVKKSSMFELAHTVYYLFGKRHRIDGPAFTMLHVDGDMLYVWLINDEIHREDDLPAKITTSGHKEWYCRGKRHRIHGPAIIEPNGRCVYFNNGNHYYKK